MDWTTEQLLGLAPDQFTLRASRGAADRQRWQSLHQDSATIWGIFPNGRNKTGEAAVFLPSLSLTCSCTSRKFPCRHTLGLLLLWQQQAKQFTPLPPPPHPAAWAQRQKAQHNRPSAPNGRPQPNTRQNLQQLKNGLHQLERWLIDMVRNGLANLPSQPKNYWEAMAHQLVDAQAPALADTLRYLANVPTSQPNWPDNYLRQIGRLYLIIQGFKKFEQLPAPTQADLQTAVGWLPTTQTKPVTDNWLVLGRQQETVGKQTRHTTWLWSETSQKIAQLIDLNHTARPAGICSPTSTVWHGSLQFLASNWPQIALRQNGLQMTNTLLEPHGYPTIRQAIQAYNQAMAVNPWLSYFPMLLHNTLPHWQEAGWQLGDSTGNILPLPDKFARGWHLAALAGGNPSLMLFGVWNGRFLQPLSVQINNIWQDIHIWRGVR